MSDHSIAAAQGCPILYQGGFWVVGEKIVHMFTNYNKTQKIYVSNAVVVQKPADESFVPCGF